MFSPEAYSQISLTLESHPHYFEEEKTGNLSNVFFEVKKGRLRDKLVESNMPHKLHLDLAQFPNVLYQVLVLLSNNSYAFFKSVCMNV